jgi:hypothetical protein
MRIMCVHSVPSWRLLDGKLCGDGDGLTYDGILGDRFTLGNGFVAAMG